MPPASLPALAVITPGPRIAKYRSRRGRRATVRRTPWAPRRKMRRPAPRTSVFSSDTWRILSHFRLPISKRPAKQMHLSQQPWQSLSPILRQQDLDRVIDGNDPQNLAGLIDNWQREQIIFSDFLRDLLASVVWGSCLQISAHNFSEWRGRFGKNQTSQGDHSHKLP